MCSLHSQLNGCKPIAVLFGWLLEEHKLEDPMDDKYSAVVQFIQQLFMHYASGGLSFLDDFVYTKTLPTHTATILRTKDPQTKNFWRLFQQAGLTLISPCYNTEEFFKWFYEHTDLVNFVFSADYAPSHYLVQEATQSNVKKVYVSSPYDHWLLAYQEYTMYLTWLLARDLGRSNTKKIYFPHTKSQIYKTLMHSIQINKDEAVVNTWGKLTAVLENVQINKLIFICLGSFLAY